MGFKEGPAAWGSLAGVGHQQRLTCLMSPLYVSRSVVSDSLPLHVLVHQAPLSMGFTRQENWSGLPFPSPEDLSEPGIEPRSPAL